MNITQHILKNKIASTVAAVLLMSAPAWGANGMNYSVSAEQGVQNGYIHKVYNEDQFNGNWKQLKGALKENWGEFTEDDLLAIEGRTDRFEGKLQERYGDRKEEVKAWVDDWMEKHPYEKTQDRQH
ncbi:MAG TPA: CsbD family protein [Nitrospirales bacterium]|nr:CsbD family protein [Nitrospirales bacterium]